MDKRVIVRSPAIGTAFKGTTNGKGITVIRPGAPGRFVVLVEGQRLQTIAVPAHQGLHVRVSGGPTYVRHITLLRRTPQSAHDKGPVIARWLGL